MGMMDRDDILILMKEGKECAFRYLFEIYYETLVMFANYWLNDPEAAEDTVQECFVDFWVNKRFENLSSGLDKYIFASVKHAALNYLRGNRRREERHAVVAGNWKEDGGEVAELNEEEIEYLYMTINRLPEERRRIFMMVCLEGRKYQEVADLLGISVNTVRTQMGRAFQFLRVALDKRRFSMFLLIVLERIQDQEARRLFSRDRE